MTTAGALTLTDIAFGPPPPNRPSRPGRRTGRAGVSTLLRSIRRELARATDAPVSKRMPEDHELPVLSR